MPRPTIRERTETEFIKDNTDKVFPEVFRETPPIPPTFAGKYALLVAIAVDIRATEAQMDALQVAIESIVNVHKAYILAGPIRLPIDRQPPNTDLKIKTTLGFTIEDKVI